MGDVVGQRSIRFPDELEVRLVRLAESERRSFANVVVKTLEEALGGSSTAEQPRSASGTNPQVGGSTPPRPASPRASTADELADVPYKPEEAFVKPPRSMFRCRVPSCRFEAPSPAARCPNHGGKLVAV